MTYRFLYPSQLQNPRSAGARDRLQRPDDRHHADTAGSDTLTGGAGNDLFIYSGGNDIITDYGTGQDTICLNSDGFSAALSGSDLLLTIGSGSIRLQGVYSTEHDTEISYRSQMYGDVLSMTVKMDGTITYNSTSGMIANSAMIVGTSSAQLASLVSTTQTGTPGGLENTGLASPEATGSSLIAAGGTSNPLTNKKTA